MIPEGREGGREGTRRGIVQVGKTKIYGTGTAA